VLDRLIGDGWLPERAVVCAITGFGQTGPRAQQVGHDLNYLGYAGALADTAPALPPVQAADLAAGSLAAALAIVAALLERERSGRGTRVDVSMTHGSHALVAHRLGGEPLPRLLTGGLACYRVYATADGRWLTIAALERRFFERLCELVGLPELSPRQYDAGAQEELAARLAERIAGRPLAAWLALLDGEEVCAGPVLSLDEAAAELGAEPPLGAPARLGEHTEQWREELAR
jgi:crotonobetainyl-CoA:carnitine CoA-transferase CaiB-like acyl-CoA transferase